MEKSPRDIGSFTTLEGKVCFVYLYLMCYVDPSLNLCEIDSLRYAVMKDGGCSLCVGGLNDYNHLCMC